MQSVRCASYQMGLGSWLAAGCVLVATATCAPAQQSGHDWPGFLGPERTGISQETGLIEDWPTEGPPVLWRVPGGTGMSGTAIAGGRLFALVQRGGEQQAICLDAKTGESRWAQAIAPAYKNGMGDGPRATPFVDGEVVYVFGGGGTLAALKVADGSIVWKHDTVAELKGKPADYGMASSPLIVDQLVVVTVGAPGATVVAYDKTTGARKWTSGDETAGYSSPALREVGGQRQLVVFAGKSAMGLVPADGRQLWRYPYQTDYDCNIATPIAVGGKVFISSGENHGCTMLELTPAGDAFQVKEAWKSLGPDSVMRNEWQTSVLLDGYLYGLDNVGSAGPVTHLSCVEAATGKQAWLQRRFGKSNLIAADGKLFFSDMHGELIVVRADPKSYSELGRAKVCGTTRQAPSLAHGLLYLRDDREIVCVDVRKP